MRTIALIAALILLGAAAAAFGADLASSPAPQAADATYDLSWWTVDGGGGRSEGGGYKLHATLGQPDAGSMSGSGYKLAGGFWVNPLFPTGSTIYLPLVQRG